MKSAYFRYQPTARVFRIEAAHGLGDPFVDRLAESAGRLGDERGLIGLVGARLEPIYVPNVRTDPRWMADDPSVRSAYFTPICARDSLLGVLGLFAAEADGFSASHRLLADAYACEVGRAWTLREQAALSLQTHADHPCALRDAVAAAFGDTPDPTHDPSPSQGAAETPQGDVDLGQLSERERDVVLAMCRGLRLSEIARVLGISHHTARNHLKRVFKKLGVHSQVELLVILSSNLSNSRLGQQRPRVGAA
jgi:DNA-binding CsgD family transcriptional regulator